MSKNNKELAEKIASQLVKFDEREQGEDTVYGASLTGTLPYDDFGTFSSHAEARKVISKHIAKDLDEGNLVLSKDWESRNLS